MLLNNCAQLSIDANEIQYHLHYQDQKDQSAKLKSHPVEKSDATNGLEDRSDSVFGLLLS
jgi:hypothetical protein